MSVEVFTVPSGIEAMSFVGGGISGALHARERSMDYLGVLLIAVATGVGGGAIRDVLLNTEPVFLQSKYTLLGLSYGFIIMAVLGGLAGYFLARLVKRLTTIIFVVDTLLIGAWVVIGVEKATFAGLGAATAIFIGTTTAVGGGLIRDVLCREIPSALMPGKWVALSALVASMVFVSVFYPIKYVFSTGQATAVAMVATIITASLLRGLSFHYDWRTPAAVDMSNQFRTWIGMKKAATTSSSP